MSGELQESASTGCLECFGTRRRKASAKDEELGKKLPPNAFIVMVRFESGGGWVFSCFVLFCFGGCARAAADRFVTIDAREGEKSGLVAGGD